MIVVRRRVVNLGLDTSSVAHGNSGKEETKSNTMNRTHTNAKSAKQWIDNVVHDRNGTNDKERINVLL